MNWRGLGQKTALDVAVESGSIECAFLLLNGGIPEHLLAESITRAAAGGHDEGLKLLIRSRLNYETSKCNLPIGEAARNGHSDCLRILLQAGADVNSEEGTAALIDASKNGHKECVSLLIKSGANVNSRTNYNTVLMEAVENGEDECTSFDRIRS